MIDCFCKERFEKLWAICYMKTEMKKITSGKKVLAWGEFNQNKRHGKVD